MLRTALFISPHLDDVAFSCGGTLAKLALADWRTHLCTIFTASVANPTGFALACQMNKGLAADIDYMRLRRAEDEDFAAHVGARHVSHLAFKEAPHRGYGSAAQLFGGVFESDGVWRAVADALQNMVDEISPELVFAPQGLGNHVDHLQTIRAVLALNTDARVLWYRDTPYALREPHAPPSRLLPANLQEVSCDITSTLEVKIRAIEAYTTQLDFQFGGVPRMREMLKDFHETEAKRTGAGGSVECFSCAESIPAAICDLYAGTQLGATGW